MSEFTYTTIGFDGEEFDLRIREPSKPEALSAISRLSDWEYLNELSADNVPELKHEDIETMESYITEYVVGIEQADVGAMTIKQQATLFADVVDVISDVATS